MNARTINPIPDVAADTADYHRVADSLARAPAFLACAVEDWSESERRALFEMLAGAVAELRVASHADFAIHAPEDGTAATAGARFARWLSRKIDTERRLAVLRGRVKSGRELVFASS